MSYGDYAIFKLDNNKLCGISILVAIISILGSIYSIATSKLLMSIISFVLIFVNIFFIYIFINNCGEAHLPIIHIFGFLLLMIIILIISFGKKEEGEWIEFEDGSGRIRERIKKKKRWYQLIPNIMKKSPKYQIIKIYYIIYG